VIGPRWLAAESRRGKRRLDDPRDLVRLEVEKALARDIRVIPVLIDDAPIPTEESLPDGLKPLARRSAVAISNENAETDIGPLIKSLRRVVSSVDIPVTNPLPLWTPARGLFLSMRLLIGVIEPMIALLAVMIPTEELYGSTRTPLFISICIVTGLLVPLATRLLTTAIYGRPARTLDIVVYWQGFVLSVGALLLPATAFDVGLSPTISLAGAAVLGFLLLRRRLATLSAGKAGARSTA